MGVVALYWVLASSRLAGLVVSTLVNNFLLPAGETITIGAVNFSFVHGRIALGSIRYTTRNTSTSAVSGFICVRYWRRRVRTSASKRDTLPPRITIELSGVEVQIFNNSDKFKEMQNLKEKRAHPDINELLSAEREIPIPPNSQAIPWYYLAAPCIEIRIAQGMVVINPMDLQFHTAVTFRRANGQLVVSSAHYPVDVYKWSLKMALHTAEVTLIPNTKRSTLGKSPSFVGTFTEGGTAIEVQSVPNFTPQRDHEPTAGWTEIGKFTYSKCWDKTKNEYICNSVERHILRSPLVKISYCQEEGGYLIGKNAYDPNHSPDFSMRVNGKDCVINYGAWANFQRALQQYRFFPEDWKWFEEKLFIPVKGAKRISGFFNMFVRLSLSKKASRSFTAFRLPYRRTLYPSEIKAGDEREYALEWMEAQAGGDIIIEYKMPWVTLPSTKGSSHIFNIKANNVTILSSFNRAPLLTADTLKVGGNLFSDNNWTAPALWTFDMTFEHAKVWLLYDHVNMMTDFANSWTSFSMDPLGARGLAYFQPIMYTVKIHLKDFDVLLNANQFNIIEKHNDMDENFYFSLASEQLDAVITLPFVEYSAPSFKVGFDINVPSLLQVRLSVPHWHTLRLMSDEYQHARFIMVEELILNGSYTYFYDKSQDVVDVMDMNVELVNPSCTLFSYYLKHFLSVKNNYLSSFQSHMSPDTFRKWKGGESSLGHEKVVGNAMDAYVRVNTRGPVSITAPVDMYSSKRLVVATFQHLGIEVRSHASFMQLQLEISPISLVIPSSSLERSSTMARSFRMDSNSNLEVDGFNLSFYLYYGPEPERETYRERYAIHVGQARGQVMAGQFMVVIDMMQNFFHHLYTWDDEIWPDINEFNHEIRRNKLRVLMEVDVHITGLELAILLTDSVFHLSSTEGARIHYDTRHTTLYTDVITVSVPPVQIYQFLPLTLGQSFEISSQDEWVEVANIVVGLDIRVVSKRDTWLAELRDQNDFIAVNDAPTGRCAVYLQQTLEALERYVKGQDDENNGEGTNKDVPQEDFAAQAKRCGRHYRANNMPSSQDQTSYGYDAVVFTLVQDRTEEDRFGRKAPNTRQHQAQGSTQMKPSTDTFFSGGSALSSSAYGDGNHKASSSSSSLLIRDRLYALADKIQSMNYVTAREYERSIIDQETTSIFLRVCENVVIAITPNTLTSVHRWLDLMSRDAPVIDSFWDSLKLKFLKSKFFSPKHRYEVLRLALTIPPLRLEFYSSLGENLNAGLLVNNLSVSLMLDEEMRISGEEVAPPSTSSASPREGGRRRGLTALVKMPVVDALGGAARLDRLGDEISRTFSALDDAKNPPLRMVDQETKKQWRLSRKATVQIAGAAKVVADAQSSPRGAEKGSSNAPLAGEKSRLRKVNLKVQLSSLSFAIFESAEPAPTPAPVLVLVVSRLSGTLLLKSPSSGREGAARVSISRIGCTTHSLLAQNIPEILVNWFFPSMDLGNSLEKFLERKKWQQELLVAGTLAITTDAYDEIPAVSPMFEDPRLFVKCAHSRAAWRTVYILRNLFKTFSPPGSEVATQLQEEPVTSSHQGYWAAVLNNVRSAPKTSDRAPVDEVLEDARVASIFGVNAPPADQAAMEMDIVAVVGPITLSASAGYVDLDRQTVVKVTGISGRGKIIMGLADKGKRMSVKVYMDVLLQKITCGVLNSVLQYGAVYQRSVGNWVTTREIEYAKRGRGSMVDINRPTPATAATAAPSSTPAPSDSNSTLLEIIGGTIKIEPIRVQAISEHGCVLLQLGGATLVYSHTQTFGKSSSGGKGGDAYGSRGGGEGQDHLQHSAVAVLGTISLSLYGTPTPDKLDVAKGRIAEVSVVGFKLSELMFVQKNALTQRKVDAYTIVGNVDRIDIPFHVGNAGQLGHFLKEWTFENAREEVGATSIWGSERVARATPPVSQDTSTHGKARPTLFAKLLVQNVRVHTGDLVALDFLYEIPGIGLEIDAQKSVAFARFNVPLHYIRFGLGQNLSDKGKMEEPSTANLAEGDLTGLFDGRQIVLPNLLLTMQYVSTWTSGTQKKKKSRTTPDWSDDEESDLDEDKDVMKKQENLTVRALLGPLQVAVKTELISQALQFVAKLEKQIDAVSQMWLNSEERKMAEPPPSVEETFNKAAASVKLWYQVSVIFSGINVKAESPMATAIFRLMDLTVQVGNEARGHNPTAHHGSDAAMHSRRNFRDFYLTVALPELSVWLLSPSVNFREGAHELFFDEGSHTEGILFAFMTHISVSNFYAFDNVRRKPLKTRSNSRAGAAEDGEQEEEEEQVSDVEQERDVNETVSLADVLQSVLVQIHNTAVILQPAAPDVATQMVTHFLSAANEFKRGVDDLVADSGTLKDSRTRLKAAAKAAKTRAAAVAEEDGFTEERAAEFVWTFLQNFSVSLEISNLALVVPFRNYRYYAVHSVPKSTRDEPLSAAAILEQYCLMAVTVDRLTLRGFAGPTSGGSKIVARAGLDVFRVGFGDDCDSLKLARSFQSFDVDVHKSCSKAVPLINFADIHEGQLSVYLSLLRTGVEAVSVELTTSGVVLEVNPGLYSNYMLLHHEFTVALEKAKAATLRAKFLVNEIRTSTAGDSPSNKVRLTRFSEASSSPPDDVPAPRKRRGSLSASMTSLLSTPSMSRSRSVEALEEDDNDDEDERPSGSLTERGSKSSLRPSMHRKTKSAFSGASGMKSPKLHIFGRSVKINVVVKIGAGRCTLFLVKDGMSFGHAKSLFEFDFPFVVLRVLHSINVGSETEADGGTTHLMAVMEPVMIRLPPEVLDFAGQISAQMRSFHKFAALFQQKPTHAAGKGNASPPVSPISPRVEEKNKVSGASNEELNLPELLSTDGLGHVTMAITIKGIRLELDCHPVTEVLCAFAVGRLDVLASSAIEGVDESRRSGSSVMELYKERSYLNVTFHLHSAEVKIYNRWIKTDAVGVDLMDVAGNIGRRQDVFEDRHKESIVSGLLGIRSIELAFAMASLKSWFVVQELWIARLKSIPFPKADKADLETPFAPAPKPVVAAVGSPAVKKERPTHRRSASNITGSSNSRDRNKKLLNQMHDRKTSMMPALLSATDSLEAPGKVEEVLKSVPKIKHRVTVAFGAALLGLKAEADLGLVGSSSTRLGSISASIVIPLDMVKDVRQGSSIPDTKISLLNVDVKLQQVAFEFTGKLRGMIRLDSLVLSGERSINAVLSMLVEVGLGPLKVDLYHKMSQIVFADVGDVKLSLSEDPKGKVLIDLSSEKVHAQVSAESISTASSIVHRLSENVDKCKNDANLVITQSKIRMTYDSASDPGSRTPLRPKIPLLRKERLLKKKSSLNFIRSVVESNTTLDKPKISLRLTAKGQDLSVALFADVMKDAQWIQATFTSYEFNLSVKAKKQADGQHDIVRDLLIQVGKAHICRMVEEEANSAKNWVRPSRADSILEFPASSMVMRSRQAVSGPRRKDLEVWFVTQFGDTIMVTLRVELYAFLRDLAMTLKSKLTAVLESNPITAPKSEPAPRRPAKPPQSISKAPKWTIDVKSFVLEPRVNVLENLTPYAINKVFELLKVGDPQTMIPEAVHAVLQQNTEKVLFAIKDALSQFDEVYTSKKSTAEASAQSKAVPRVVLPQMTPGTARLAGLSSISTPPSASAKQESPRSKALRAGLTTSASPAVSRNVTPMMPRLTPALSRIDSKGVDKGKDEDSVFTLLDEDF